MQTNYDSRKEYIQQIKESFQTPSSYERKKHDRFESDYSNEEPAVIRSFGKIRLLAAVLCFLGFITIHQTGYQWKNLSEKTIVTQIQKDYDLKDVKNCFSEIRNFFEK